MNRPRLTHHEVLLVLGAATWILRAGGIAAHLREQRRSAEEKPVSVPAAILLVTSLFTETLAIALGVASTVRNRQWWWLAGVAAFGTLATTPYALIRRGNTS